MSCVSHFDTYINLYRSIMPACYAESDMHLSNNYQHKPYNVITGRMRCTVSHHLCRDGFYTVICQYNSRDSLREYLSFFLNPLSELFANNSDPLCRVCPPRGS
jgi:hypothetical protein